MTRDELVNLQMAVNRAALEMRVRYDERDGSVERDLAYRLSVKASNRAEDAYNNGLDEFAKETA